MENLEYIDAYFGKNHSDTEKREFELRCENDKAFAEDVAFYVTARQEAKAALLKEKQTQWKEESDKNKEVFFIKPFKRISDYKWWYAVAACLVLAFGTYFFERQSSPEQLANNYINKNFSQLGIQMDGDMKDSMQIGINDYNDEQFRKALPIFETLYKDHPENSDALKDAGIIYLVNKNYDKALEKFDELQNKSLHSNPGTFYKALTLLRRNKDGDKAAAKQMLQQVQQQHLEKSKEAEEWLKKF